jgi:N-succinyldiaminopimelate aminotransferase
MAEAPWRRTAQAAGLLGSTGSIAPTIFAEMTALAARTGAVNLGQGFPDFDGPSIVLETAQRAIRDGVNQYSPGRGHPDLLEAIAEHQRHWYGLGTTTAEVLVTAGATEALAATMLAYLEPGDEVVVFEPCYDAYAAIVGLTGARLVPIPLAPPTFEPDASRIERAFTSRTRMVVVNSPHNPSGVVFDEDVLREIVRCAQRRDALIVTDEVYEHLVYDGRHVPMAQIDGARDRLVSISSGGKTFSTTGWKVGWLVSTPERVAQITSVKQYLTFVNGAPFQPAIAAGLRMDDEAFDTLAASFARKRDLLTRGLRSVGFTVPDAQAGYFVLADGTALGFPDATDLARRLPELAGVVGVPVAPFARPSRHDLRPWMRFAFCKRDEVLRDAVERLGALRGIAAAPPAP